MSQRLESSLNGELKFSSNGQKGETRPPVIYRAELHNQSLENKQAALSNKEFIALSLLSLEQLNVYLAGRGDVRDSSFFSLKDEEKAEVYKSSLDALNKITGDNSLKEKMEGKLVTLVGIPGVSFENNEIRIGPGSNAEDIINLIVENVPDNMDNNTTQEGLPSQEEVSVGNNQNAPDSQNPEPTPAPTLDATSSLASENSPQPEKTLEEEYAELANIRDDLAKTEALKNNFSTDTGTKVEELRAKYDDQKDRISEMVAGQIAGSHGWNTETDIPSDKLKSFRSEVNDVLFEKLVKEENDAYINSLKANREETWGDKAKEGLRYVLGSKGVQWYTKQNKWFRLGMTTLLATGVGYGVGTIAAAGAVGYAGARIVRGAASLTASASVNKYLQREDSILSIEALNEKEQREIEVLKRKDMPLDAKSKELERIKASYDLKRKRRALAKGAITVGAGAAGGLLAGLSEHLADGFGGGSKSVLESSGGKTGIQGNKFGRGIFDPNSTQNQDDLAKVIGPKLSVGDQSSINVRPEIQPETPEIPPRIETEDIKVVVETPEGAPVETPAPHPVEEVMPKPTVLVEQPSFKPEVLVQEAGGKTDSVWKMLKNVLENNDRFKNLSGSGTPEEIAKQIEAKQTRILQSLVGEVLENHEKYGVGADGEIVVGQKVDFSELFKDGKKFNEVLNDAENLKPATIKNIVENNAKIATYLSEHPGEKLTSEKVTEILNTKPKAQLNNLNIEGGRNVYEEEYSGAGIQNPPEQPNTLNAESGMLQEDINNELNPDGLQAKNLANGEDFVLRVPKPKYSELERTEIAGTDATEADVTNIDHSATEKAVLNEIAEAKQKLKIPDETTNPSKQSVGGLRNLRSMPEDVALQVQSNKVVGDLINDIYQKKGILGLGRVEGVKSPEWSEIRKLPAHKVFDFYKNPESSKLPKSILESLQGSVRHRKLFEALQAIAEQEAGGDIRPFERDDDTMEIYIKRLANFVVNRHTQNKTEEVLKMAA